MRVALTGTPGTGKTTASERLPDEYAVVHLNAVVEGEGLWTERDDERDSLVVDVDALRAWVDDTVGAPGDEDCVVLDSHLAHLLDADRVVVLRCRPDVLESRLHDRGMAVDDATEDGESAEPPRALARKARENAEPTESSQALARKARENAESEALDVILSEAVGRHGEDRVYEIDTTDRTPDEVAAEVEAVVAGERDPSAGDVDFTGYLHP